MGGKEDALVTVNPHLHNKNKYPSYFQQKPHTVMYNSLFNSQANSNHTECKASVLTRYCTKISKHAFNEDWIENLTDPTSDFCYIFAVRYKMLKLIHFAQTYRLCNSLWCQSCTSQVYILLWFPCLSTAPCSKMWLL